MIDAKKDQRTNTDMASPADFIILHKVSSASRRPVVPPPTPRTTPTLGGDAGVSVDIETGGRSKPDVETSALVRARNVFQRRCGDNSTRIRTIALSTLFVGYFVYYGFAMAYDVEYATTLTVFTALGLVIIVVNWTVDRGVGQWLKETFFRPVLSSLKRNWFWMKWYLLSASFCINNNKISMFLH